MREIKFRAWCKSLKLMQQSFTLTADRGMLGNLGEIHNEEYVLMQYTGLKDKNGVEVYEGDILSLFDPRPQVEHKKRVSEVVFSNGAFLVDTQTGALPDRTTHKTLYEHLRWREYSECEVVGNIYENPDLLKDGDAA